MKRVFVVGRSPEAARICEIFREVNAEAVRFPDPQDLADASHETPHLVVCAEELASRTDLTLRAIRKTPSMRSIAILACYPAFTVNVEARGRKAGANEVLLYPVERRILLAKSASLLSIDKRRAFKTLLTVEARSGSVMARSEDFSLSGLSFIGESYLSDEEAVQLHFFLPGNAERISISGSIVRRTPLSENKFYYGVRFEESDLKKLQQVADFIDKGR